jgi:4-alpha-glucanotransferase
MKRSSGILLPVFSLPSKYGIGCFSWEAYDFIDFLSKAGQSYWQILPLVPAGECESPYSSPSTFAGNPLFIDLEQLIIQRLLTRKEIESYEWDNLDIINYSQVKENKMELLYSAFTRSNHYKDPWFIEFCKENEYWLDEYAMYMESTEGKPIDFYIFLQFIFDVQWKRVKEYANRKGIKIIGDLPLYVSLNSADAYNNPELFQIGSDMKLSAVAGCPPDMSAEDGQIWGNPLYDWEYHKKTGYRWWVERMKRCAVLHDVVRLDHFRGFYDYYAIPAEDKNAKNGEWKLGPAMDLFKVLEEQIPELEFIAEDLGFLSPGVHDLMRETGYPGMKILQFAFNGGKDNPYLPENISENYVVYTGTHDNNTTLGWYNNATDWEKEHLRQYIPELENVSWDLAELAMSTKANLCIIQMQDYLELDGDCRTNTPGTININWKWKMIELPTIQLAEKIKNLTEKYNR